VIPIRYFKKAQFLTELSQFRAHSHHEVGKRRVLKKLNVNHYQLGKGIGHKTDLKGV